MFPLIFCLALPPQAPMPPQAPEACHACPEGEGWQWSEEERCWWRVVPSHNRHMGINLIPAPPAAVMPLPSHGRHMPLRGAANCGPSG